MKSDVAKSSSSWLKLTLHVDKTTGAPYAGRLVISAACQLVGPIKFRASFDLAIHFKLSDANEEIGIDEEIGTDEEISACQEEDE